MNSVHRLNSLKCRSLIKFCAFVDFCKMLEFDEFCTLWDSANNFRSGLILLSALRGDAVRTAHPCARGHVTTCTCIRVNKKIQFL